MLLFLGFLPMCIVGGFLTNENYYVSATDDFNNYYDIIANEGTGHYEQFPSEVNGEVVSFSYYYKYFWIK